MTLYPSIAPGAAVGTSRRKAVWGPKRTFAAAFTVMVALAANVTAAERHMQRPARARDGRPNAHVQAYKVDKELTYRSTHHNPAAKTSVIVELKSGAQVPSEFRLFKRPNGQLRIINGHVLDLPNRMIARMALHPDVFRLHFNRPTSSDNYRTSLTIGTRIVQQTLGLTGEGVGVAILDSGIATWHDDLTNHVATTTYPYSDQRVSAFVDFVNGLPTPYDDLGHGSHVAGIIAGNGTDSNGRQAGTAPGASLVSLKVLDAEGGGTISTIIQALDWVLVHHAEYNIRVVNLSVGAQIHESYWTDPLTLAAKRVVDAGVVVVAAAGNWGHDGAGAPLWGGIAAPGNAPWVITIGASSSVGTSTRSDDTIASFSSRGPTYLDWSAKPDLVAPGTGTVSLAVPGSTFYTTRAQALLPGSVNTGGVLPYLSLSGTSMAAPVVTGVVAQMLQVNPTLTPNAVKAILQYTAQVYPGHSPLEQGAGFLNAVGAVRLARFFATAQPGQLVPTQRMWSKHLIWGSHELHGGLFDPTANAFQVGTTWGVAKTDDNDNIIWGTQCGSSCDGVLWGTSNIIWGTAADTSGNIIWGTDDSDNIIWGTDCAGADCDNIIWGTTDSNNIIWGTAAPGDTIVWGTAGLNADNIVWGASNIDNIIWGTDDDDNIIWGTNDDDNIIWGTNDDDNIIWGTNDDDNIIWGTDDGADNIIWGTDDNGNIIWGTNDNANIIWGTAGSLVHVWQRAPDGTISPMVGSAVFDQLGDKGLLRLIEHVMPPSN